VYSESKPALKGLGDLQRQSANRGAVSSKLRRLPASCACLVENVAVLGNVHVKFSLTFSKKVWAGAFSSFHSEREAE
jgi:hypothetical protein